jgi:hypothetical protein
MIMAIASTQLASVPFGRQIQLHERTGNLIQFSTPSVDKP